MYLIHANLNQLQYWYK